MATLTKIATGGHIAHFDVFISGNTITATTKRGVEAKRKVEGLSKFVEKAKDLRIGWAQLPDFNVIYIYDKADDYFGYALNVEAPELSEWGYAPFGKDH